MILDVYCTCNKQVICTKSKKDCGTFDICNGVDFKVTGRMRRRLRVALRHSTSERWDGVYREISLDLGKREIIIKSTEILNPRTFRPFELQNTLQTIAPYLSLLLIYIHNSKYTYVCDTSEVIIKYDPPEDTTIWKFFEKWTKNQKKIFLFWCINN